MPDDSRFEYTKGIKDKGRINPVRISQQIWLPGTYYSPVGNRRNQKSTSNIQERLSCFLCRNDEKLKKYFKCFRVRF